MKISNYLPNLYKNNVEMNNIIYSEEQEFENRIKQDINNRFNDTFAIKATEKGISKFETLLGIKSDSIKESINFRRTRIINRLVSSIPFTETFLINQLDNILGKGNWSYNIDYNNYTLDVYSLLPGDEWYQELLSFFTRIVPCNIQWKVTIYSATWNQVLNKFETWNDISNMTWEEVMNGEWVNS